MDILNQNRILMRATVVMMVLNFVLISFFIFKETRPHREAFLYPQNEKFKDVSSILRKKLQLTNEQVIAFENIRKRNFEKQFDLKQIIRDDKDEMNIEMFNKNIDYAKTAVLSKKIAQNELKMEQLQFAQAKELKAVCTPEQLDKFQDLVIEIRDYFRPDNQPNRR